MKIVNFGAVVTLLALTSLPARSQKPAAPLPATTAAPWTRGSCSPVVTGQNDQFTIHCPGMTNEQGEKLLGIVNKILANELDPQLVLAKLDEIQRGLKPNLPLKTYFCDGMWQSVGPKADTVLDSKTGGNDFDFLNMISLFKSNHSTGDQHVRCRISTRLSRSRARRIRGRLRLGGGLQDPEEGRL